MCFLMTSNITIGDYTNIKPSGVKWKCSVSNFTDTCTISVPLKTFMRHNNTRLDVYPDKSTEQKVMELVNSNQVLFNEGDKVSVLLGYDLKNTKRFMGFVKRINYAVPLVIECEGYSYQLTKKVFTKSYKSTTVRDILSDLIVGTDIVLSKYIPTVPLTNVVFKNCPGLKVLEWFAKECLMTVYFDFDQLYVGASKYAVKKPTQKIKMGWNTIGDGSLKKDTSESEVIIHVVEKNSSGNVKRTKSEQKKYSTTKEVKVRSGLTDAVLKDIANDLQKLENYSGYKGEVTTFLDPHFENGYVANVIDERFPDRNGMYFVESVDGSFDSNGGRQKLTLRYYGAN